MDWGIVARGPTNQFDRQHCSHETTNRWANRSSESYRRASFVWDRTAECRRVMQRLLSSLCGAKEREGGPTGSTARQEYDQGAGDQHRATG